MKIIVITGPTGIGKTKLSIALAHQLNGEIMNADSMQIYKGLDIGTAKIKEDEKEGIKHHLLDIKKINENYTVYDYQKDGRKVINDILKRNKRPIIVGGTGLYIKALLYDYRFKKETINNHYDELSKEEIYAKLKEIDPKINIDINNRRRLIRALIRYQNNQNKDNKKGNKLLYDAIFIGLTTKRNLLYQIINKRVDKMIEDGLIDEVKSLYNQNIKSKPIINGIGYKELYRYFDGELTLDEAIELIKKNSRYYAKRQYTWFNNQMNINWFEVDLNHFDKTIKEVITFIKRHDKK